jgi:hypothetical protein
MANILFSWIWAKISGRTPFATPSRLSIRKDNTHDFLANEENWQFVSASLERLENAGFRINPTLDRDLIVFRAICSMAERHEGDDLASLFASTPEAPPEISVDLELLAILSAEDIFFHELRETIRSQRRFSTIEDQSMNALTDTHSRSIFKNAFDIWTVNECNPGEYIPEHVRELEALACGDFVVQSVTETTKPDLLVGVVTLSDGRTVSFEMDDRKRPDVTPFFQAMNALIAHLRKGRFVAISFGSCENFTTLYLHAREEAAFRSWSLEQHYFGFSAPVDWFDDGAPAPMNPPA